MSPGEATAILFSVFGLLILLRVPVSFALGLACVPVYFFDDKLTPVLFLNEMFKSYNSFILLAVPFFLLAANLMNAAGITDRLIELSRATVGHLRGGLGHINVMVSMLFAGISGSSTADAAGIGSLLIPAMKKQGYTTSFTVAITACSSVMGVIIPPSIMMLVWGGVMSVSIGGLFLAGVVPGVLIGLSMMVAVRIYAKVYDYPMYTRSSLREFTATLAKSFLALMTPLIIIVGITGGFFTPTEASVIAVFYSLFLAIIVYRSITLRMVPQILYDSARFSAIPLFAIGTASSFAWLLAYHQIPVAVVSVLEELVTGPISTGLIIAGAFLIIGMFIDSIPALIILGTVLAPVADTAGIHPIHFAIIGVISLAFGLVTPPYGLCLLIACGIGEIRVIEALRDVGIILIPMMLILLFVIFFPDVILALPRLVMPKFIG